jgi:hypothetical protein
MDTFFSKAKRWVQKQYVDGGTQGLCSALFDAVRWETLKLSPSFKRDLEEHLTFDSLYGTDTSGDVFLDELDISEEQKKTSYWYEPAPPWLIRSFIESIPLDLTETSLIDLGSGKGRVLLVGSCYPFEHIRGIELSEQLHHSAVKNIEIFNSEKQRCFDIEAIQGDATTYEFPQTSLVISLFNPFGEEVLQQVLDNILTSLRQTPRDCFIAYINPKHRNVLDKNSALSLIKKTRRYLLYQITLP